MGDNILTIQADANFSFFLTRNMYAGKFAKIWAREVIQNAVDAKAKGVHIKNTRLDEHNLSILTVEDDGVGMTEEIVKNNFLSLGGSHKEDVMENGIRKVTGGLGIAKSVCIGGDVKYKGPFGYDVTWWVETTCVKNGKFITYYFDSEMIGKENIRILTPKEQTGTKIVIHKREYIYDYLIKDVIHNSNVVPVFFEEDELLQLRRARKQDISTLFSDETDISWVDVYHKKNVLSRQENLVIFRINGIVQFTQKDSHIPGALIFEIKTNKKPWDEDYPFTPTREQIKDGYGYQEVINTIIEHFRVTVIDNEKESFTFETFENDFHNENTYHRYYEQSIEEVGLHKQRADSLYDKTKNTAVFVEEEENNSDEPFEDAEEIDGAEEKENNEKEKNSIYEYERIQKEKERKRLKTAQVQEFFHKVIRSVQSEEDQRITTFNTVFSSHLPSISVKREKHIKSGIDLYNAKNSKTLLAFKLFIDMIFELTGDKLQQFDYEIGWSLNDKRRVEYTQRDYKRFLLLNPIDLNISDVRLFTNKVLNNLVYEMLKSEHYYTSDYMMEKYFEILEECIYPNIRSFEKAARKILRTII